MECENELIKTSAINSLLIFEDVIKYCSTLSEWILAITESEAQYNPDC